MNLFTFSRCSPSRQCEWQSYNRYMMTCVGWLGSERCGQLTVCFRCCRDDLRWPVPVPPTFTIIPKDEEVTANGRIKLVCAAKGIPTPVITWKVNNTNIPSTYTRLRKKQTFSLIIVIVICCAFLEPVLWIGAGYADLLQPFWLAIKRHVCGFYEATQQLCLWRWRNGKFDCLKMTR